MAQEQNFTKYKLKNW